MIDDNIPKFDIPRSFIVGNNIDGNVLNLYGRFPCKIKAGIFVLCKKGRIRARINLSEYVVRENDLITLPPGTFIQIREVDEDIELYFAAFCSDIATKVDFIPAASDNPVIGLGNNASSIFEDLFRFFMKVNSHKDAPISTEMINAVLNLFLQSVKERYHDDNRLSQAANTRGEEIYDSFMKLLMDNYIHQHSVSYYAERLGITLQHFCNTIKKVTGKTALEIINSIIIMDAKAQLKSTTYPINNIAGNLGFSNQAFFNKYFKQHVGMTPHEYRKS